jgi:hypothetical protein
MVQIGCFEKFLKMVLRLSCLALVVTLGSCDILVGVVCFLVIVVAAGSDCNPPEAPLLPLLAALSTFLSAFDGGFGWCGSVAADGRFPTT